MTGFTDRFAYAIEVARLRDGLKGTVDELRETSVSNALEDVLDQKARNEMRQRAPGREITVEEYNEAWAESYLAMVERNGSVRDDSDDELDRVLGKLLPISKANP